MKIKNVRRFNPKKKGSFEIDCSFTDWDLSIIIGGLKFYLKNKKLPKGTQTFVKNLIQSFGKALSKVLKYEMTDLKDIKRLK